MSDALADSDAPHSDRTAWYWGNGYTLAVVFTHFGVACSLEGHFEQLMNQPGGLFAHLTLFEPGLTHRRNQLLQGASRVEIADRRVAEALDVRVSAGSAMTEQITCQSPQSSDFANRETLLLT